ncbi:GNAT family N-acetyltransferase [Alteromonadaceae bacterium BrNp21-10]|nr:GNAT family N-acetyltransferase [Alteromonadaceae bacterium BrNp21-10]
MQLISPTKQHIQQMLGWFTNKQQSTTWGGPQFRYPFTEQSFIEDLKLDTLASHVIEDSEGRCLAFGQYYARVGRCHLGRLAVSPAHRGQGIGKQLIHLLTQQGKTQLGVSECSLFVYEDNRQAYQLYLRLGFREMDYPEAMPMAECLYMVLA